MKVYLATWLLEPSQGNALTTASAARRLISYYHTKDLSRGEVRKYLLTGENKKEERN